MRFASLSLVTATVLLPEGVVGQITSHPTPSICNASPSRPILRKVTQAPTDSPTKAPTKAPVNTPFTVPTNGPTKAPVPPPPVAPPVGTPVAPPVEAPFTVPTLDISGVVPTEAPTSNTILRELCVACADKSPQIEGTGKVTGGGWIYLTKQAYYNPAKICDPKATDICVNQFMQMEGSKPGVTSLLEGKKANFGFNAMWRNGKPMGSTNFDFDGGYFHFHSTTQNTPLYSLEVLNDPTGAIDGWARWMGTGTLASTLMAKKQDERDGFCFMVSVIDKGEPGAEDQWRLRIWQCEGPVATTLNMTLSAWNAMADRQDLLIFDTHYDTYSSITATYPLPSEMSRMERFNGQTLGELTSNGGGNIQIHKPHKNNPNLQKLLDERPQDCECPKKDYEGDCTTGFVTGGGWIYLDNAYMALWAPGSLAGVKANFGFNAKAFHGEPTGSTNFNIEGNSFHFHTDNSGKEYDGLHVVCLSDKFGKQAKETFASWTGIGKLSRTDPPDAGWEYGYRFFVTVQDFGEPGDTDTFRIRIYDKPSSADQIMGEILFDSFGDQGDAMWDFDPQNAKSTISYAAKGPDFKGNELGSLMENKKGGGNVVVHCKGGPNKMCPNGVAKDMVTRPTIPPPVLPMVVTQSVVSSTPLANITDSTDFVNNTKASCEDITCTIGPWNCGGRYCSYQKGLCVTLLDDEAQASAIYREVTGLNGRRFIKVTVYATTENYSGQARWKIEHSFGALSSTANFISSVSATYSEAIAGVAYTATIALADKPVDDDTAFIRILSDTRNTRDKLKITKIVVDWIV
ncbi:hypothetical protein ACA910_005541 [Epithemia clementina (nom. ined.)]